MIFPVEYRRKIFTAAVIEKLKEVCEKNRDGIRNEICGNRNGRRSCAYARAGNTDNERKPNGEDDKEHNGEGNIQGVRVGRKQPFRAGRF